MKPSESMRCLIHQDTIQQILFKECFKRNRNSSNRCNNKVNSLKMLKEVTQQIHQKHPSLKQMFSSKINHLVHSHQVQLHLKLQFMHRTPVTLRSHSSVLPLPQLQIKKCVVLLKQQLCRTKTSKAIASRVLKKEIHKAFNLQIQIKAE